MKYRKSLSASAVSASSERLKSLSLNMAGRKFKRKAAKLFFAVQSVRAIRSNFNIQIERFTRVDYDEMPVFERVRKKSREVKHGKMNHYFRRNSCIGKKTFHDLKEAKDYRREVCNYIKLQGNIPDKTKIYECPFCKKFHMAHVEER